MPNVCLSAAYADRWKVRATEQDPDYLARTNPSTGQPSKLRLTHDDLETAALQYAKIKSSVQSPEHLGLPIPWDDPFRDCPACAEPTRDQLNDGGFLGVSGQGGQVGGWQPPALVCSVTAA